MDSSAKALFLVMESVRVLHTRPCCRMNPPSTARVVHQIVSSLLFLCSSTDFHSRLLWLREKQNNMSRCRTCDKIRKLMLGMGSAGDGGTINPQKKEKRRRRRTVNETIKMRMSKNRTIVRKFRNLTSLTIYFPPTSRAKRKHFPFCFSPLFPTDFGTLPLSLSFVV